MLHLHQLNAFLEDTCVLVTMAYLLSRGPLLPRIFDGRRNRHDQIALALVFSLIGASELIFPGDRQPYVPATLAASFAGYAGGMGLGLLSTALMAVMFTLARLTQTTPSHLLVFDATLFTITLLGAAVRHWTFGTQRPGLPLILAGACITGTLSELTNAAWHSLSHAPWPPALAASVVANGFGCTLLALVLHDAWERREAVRRYLEDEQEMTSLRMSQLNELQARLHPHFLFNALAAVAGLCVINPPQAERAVTTLARLLRRFLQSPSEVCVPLSEELATVRAYLEIEGLRLGERLDVIEDVPDRLLALPVPRFCLQIPVENAILHGIAPTGRLGHVWITARRRHPKFLLLAVADDGAGFVPLPRPAGQAEATHGLSLLAIRLRLSAGLSARLRLCSRPGEGTLCAIRLPV